MTTRIAQFKKLEDLVACLAVVGTKGVLFYEPIDDYVTGNYVKITSSLGDNLILHCVVLRVEFDAWRTSVAARGTLVFEGSIQFL